MSSDPRDRWRPTAAHLRATVTAGVLALTAVLLRRPDLVVLATPFVVVATWGQLARPLRTPRAGARFSRSQVAEGRSGVLTVSVTPVARLDTVALSVAASPFTRLQPDHGTGVVRVEPPTDGEGPVSTGVAVVATRWGARQAGPALVAGAGPWGAFRWGPVPLPGLTFTAVPRSELFDTSAPAPHPRGVVGLHRSDRRGDGSEFATIRPFQWGDRLKRIHWARSLRTGELHVTTTHADHDTHVAVLLDAHYDLGRSEGVEGRPSSLDLSVRAAGALAEHFLQQGDRVSLRVLSRRTPLVVPVGTGRRHLVRVLHTLAAVEAGPREESDTQRLRTGMRAGTLVVMVSALVSPDALTQAAVLARSGLSVVVVDTLDERIRPHDEETLGVLAWRVRMLERDAEIRRVQSVGVPVVPWRGPGSLDTVLRLLSHRRVGGAA